MIKSLDTIKNVQQVQSQALWIILCFQLTLPTMENAVIVKPLQSEMDSTSASLHHLVCFLPFWHLYHQNHKKPTPFSCTVRTAYPLSISYHKTKLLSSTAEWYTHESFPLLILIQIPHIKQYNPANFYFYRLHTLCLISKLLVAIATQTLKLWVKWQNM